jgi:hypothetical protein
MQLIANQTKAAKSQPVPSPTPEDLRTLDLFAGTPWAKPVVVARRRGRPAKVVKNE